MEHVGFDMNKVLGSVHTKAYHHSIGTHKSGYKVLEKVDEQFHVYAIEWLPDQIKYYMDGEMYFKFKPADFVEPLLLKNGL